MSSTAKLRPQSGKDEEQVRGLFKAFSVRGKKDTLLLRICAALTLACAVSVQLRAQGDQPSAQLLPQPRNQLILSGDAYCGLNETRHKDCRLGDRLYVGFRNLEEWMNDSSNRVSDVALVLNGRVMYGIKSAGPDSSYKYLWFDLIRLQDDQTLSLENREEWDALMREIPEDHRLHIHVAASGNPPYWGPEATVPFKIVPFYGTPALGLVMLILLALLTLFFYIVISSGIVSRIAGRLSFARRQRANSPVPRPAVISASVATPTAPKGTSDKWDVFVSHASEDKPYVEPLITGMRAAGISIWYDTLVLEWGDDLRGTIDRGLVNCRYGIVILSKAFLRKKKWTEHELNGLFAREESGRKLVLPIWHGITRDDLLQYSPQLADRLAKVSENDSYDNIVSSLLAMLGRPSP